LTRVSIHLRKILSKNDGLPGRSPAMTSVRVPGAMRHS
jgi:hypothetical protein